MYLLEWTNKNQGALFAILMLFVTIIIVFFYLVDPNFRKLFIRNNFWRVILFTFGGIIGGLLFFSLSQITGLLYYISLFIVISWLIYIIILFVKPNLWECEKIILEIPQFSQFTFSINKQGRLIAWNLFIETITRISTQPLSPDEGYIKEALNSLYILFTTTRNLLKDSAPSKTSKNSDEMNVEMFAVSMLNDVLRPFLSKWHPLLTQFEKDNPTKPEKEWEYNNLCRKELEKTRLIILNYAKGFGELAEVDQLDFFFNQKNNWEGN